jgi:hypothetical protein
MSDDMETVLRNSLDAVDRARRWATVGVLAFFVAMTIAVAALLAVAAHAGQSTSGDALMLKSLYVASAARMLFIACCTALVMFQVTKMTKSLLRAVDLTKQ